MPHVLYYIKNEVTQEGSSYIILVHETHKAVCKLQKTPLEQRDGSLCLMPTVVVTATKDDENDDLMVDDPLSSFP